MKKGNNVYIIAELSANHNNDYSLAEKTITAMAESGADAVKVQTYTADSLSLNVNNEFFGPKKNGLWKGRRLYELYEEAAMPYEWQPKLKRTANDLGMDFFSSPFDKQGVDFLEELNVPRYKIASFEINDIPLIEYTASKGKPIIISTGVANENDIRLALKACFDVGNYDITLLKCTSQYPATIDQTNLRTITDMKQRFGVKVGLSDHTPGELVPTVAVSLGAEVVEKHFILDRSLGGPDSAFSMEPKEFAEMVQAIRNTEKALGKVSYELNDKDKLRRRSLFVIEDIKTGQEITKDNIRSIRPGYGMEPKFYNEVIGRKVKVDLKKGTPLSRDHI